MNKAQFLHQFLLQPAPSINWQAGALRQSAVLVALQEQPHGLDVILTRRAAHLRSQPHQICFAGGRRDISDPSLLHTALREAEEELGITPEQVEIIGELPCQPVLNNFMIHPYVGFIAPSTRFSPQPEEVAEVLRVPLQRLVQHAHHHITFAERLLYNELVFIPVDGQLIWGATAAIIRRLADQLYPQTKHLRQQFYTG
jgi:8-oxo-dGTP pyrophosphatase MutT (NUDIX family)